MYTQVYLNQPGDASGSYAIPTAAIPELTEMLVQLSKKYGSNNTMGTPSFPPTTKTNIPVTEVLDNLKTSQGLINE